MRNSAPRWNLQHHSDSDDGLSIMRPISVHELDNSARLTSPPSNRQWLTDIPLLGTLSDIRLDGCRRRTS